MSVETYGTPTTADKINTNKDCLFNPVIDFLCLGGGFFVLFLPITFYLSKDDQTVASIGIAAMIAANFINHPHFVHSYQIFYRNFRWKIFSEDSLLKQKYLISGVGVPVVLASFFSYCMVTSDYKLLGFAGNLMAFLVGWHYTKQGYGILMVSAVLKQNFYNSIEKRVLLVNCYSVWIFTWVKTNQVIAAKSLWGIEYFALGFPDWVIWITAVPMVITSIMVMNIFVKRIINDFSAFPKNGAIAYITSLYIWLILLNIHPVLALLAPGFHSLQYLVVIWRYEINKSESDYQNDVQCEVKKPRSVKRRLFVFALAGFIFGIIGFWLLPTYMDNLISFAISDLSNTAFIFMFWIFINIHHYFIDNVIWKKENTDVARHLFSRN